MARARSRKIPFRARAARGREWKGKTDRLHWSVFGLYLSLRLLTLNPAARSAMTDKNSPTGGATRGDPLPRRRTAATHAHSRGTGSGVPESLDPLFAGMLLVFFMLGLYAAGVWFFSENMASRGQFGDMFGGVNSIVSGMTLAGLVFTIYLQRIELQLAHDEVAWREATNIKQQVGSTFFRLLQLQATILTDLTITTQIGTLRGRAAFADAQNRLKRIHPGYRFRHRARSLDRCCSLVREPRRRDREGARPLFQESLPHYQFIDESDITDDAKKQYTSIARA